MTSLIVIENKVSSIGKYLGILNGYKKYSQQEIESSVDLKGAVERYLYLAIQSTIELAEAVISDRGFRKPATMSESFHILNEEGLISNELTEDMVKMTGFRNVVSHDYEKMDYGIVYDVLQNKLGDIENFVSVIAKK